MNEFEAKLERLVDGELPREEYALLIRSLDHQPHGWKSCALMFLEQQALTSELRNAVPPPLNTLSATTGVRKATPRTDTAKRVWPQLAALASSLVLTFWLGRGSVTTPPATNIDTVPSIVKSQPDDLPSLPSHGRMTLVMNGADGRPREVELPVVNGEHVDPQQVLDEGMVIPPEVLAALRNAGYRLESRRELVPLRLNDQQQVVVPVDHVRVAPTRRRTF